MTMAGEQIINLITTPIFLVVIGLEWLLSLLDGVRAYTMRDTLHNFGLSLLSGLIGLLARGLSVLILTFFFQFEVIELPHSVLYWIVLLLFVDMMHYWLHRVSHFCRLLWAVHVNHHSSEKFNFSIGFRTGVLQPLYSFIFFIPIALAGFQPADIFLIYSINQIWAVLTHTERVRKLGWLECLFVTPSHHRVHHASNPLYLDKNMGTVFIIWDKLFGTFQEELDDSTYQPIQYGLTHPLQDQTLPNIVFHEWRNIWKDVRRTDITWSQKLRYLFGPPGWCHDGSRQTSEQLRAQSVNLQTA